MYGKNECENCGPFSCYDDPFSDRKMPKKKPAKDPRDDLEATCKLLCGEALNHMKVRNYSKAFLVYNKVCNARAQVRWPRAVACWYG